MARTQLPHPAGQAHRLSVGTTAWPEVCLGDGQDRGAEVRGVAAEDDGARGGDHVVRLAQGNAADLVEATVLFGVQPDVESTEVVLQLRQGARSDHRNEWCHGARGALADPRDGRDTRLPALR
jgi:hypothetical protein